ncbi:MAG: hypothetical protein ACRYGM_05235 [Janthinobacterium lividum]
MSRLQQDRTALEYPELAAAYEASATTAARVNEMAERLKTAKAEFRLRKRDREALGGRAAQGENVTGAHLRQADEAMRDAEATITLLTEALPAAIRAAEDGRGISDMEWAAKSDALAPFRVIRDQAKAALAQAQAAFEAAEADANHLPQEAAEAFEALLQRHGRGRRPATPFLSHVLQVKRENEVIKDHNRFCNPGNEKPLKSWMPE